MCEGRAAALRAALGRAAGDLFGPPSGGYQLFFLWIKVLNHVLNMALCSGGPTRGRRVVVAPRPAPLDVPLPARGTRDGLAVCSGLGRCCGDRGCRNR